MDVEVLSWQDVVRREGTVARARRAVADERWAKVMTDAYVGIEVEIDVAVRAAAARKALPDGVVLSHWAGLWVLGLEVLPRDQSRMDILDVTALRGHRVERRPGLRPHSALVTDDELCEVNGLLVVSAGRGVVDVARSFGLVEGVALGDAALRAGATTQVLIEESIERAAGLKGVVTARDVVPHLEPRSESLMESRLRLGFVLAGGPRMRAQVDLYDDHGAHCGRGDLYLDGVVVEYDGREQRLLKAAFVKDRYRQGDINDVGVEIRRFTSDDYYGTTAAARLGRLRRALEVARGRTRERLRFGPDTLRPPKLRPLPTVGDRKRRDEAA